MHELSIVTHVAKTLDELAEENHLTKIGSVTLEIGEVSGIITDYFIDCWDYFKVKHPLLKEADPNVRVLLASGYVEEEDVQDLLSNGAISFMRKPYLLKDLARRIREILDKTGHDNENKQ